ncbi:hypothetical protein [Candidatus Cardinium sp. cBcalN1]|uniref:hypothetical protein n=2 Tax=unclassified Candidatus Cardinium TaxID=2641185 RepID=UPI001FB4D5A8|nr:hypothetical protein [Candidatus Cardinium sp. cBcalN1]
MKIKKTYMRSMERLFISLFGFHALSSCVNTNRQLGMLGSQSNKKTEAVETNPVEAGTSTGIPTDHTMTAPGPKEATFLSINEAINQVAQGIEGVHDTEHLNNSKHFQSLSVLENSDPKYSKVSIYDAISEGLEINGIDPVGNPVLNLAIEAYLRNNNSETRLGITFLLEKGVDVNQRDYPGNTPLLIVVRSLEQSLSSYKYFVPPDKVMNLPELQNKYKLLEELIGRGAKWDVKDKHGNNPRSEISRIPDKFKSYFSSFLS